MPKFKENTSPFRMKSPLKEGVSGHSNVDTSVYKPIHKDRLVHRLSRQPENFNLSTRELKNKARRMRGE